MNVDFFAGIAWRDIVLAAAAVIGVYLVLSVLRLFKVADRRAAPKPGAGPGFAAWEPHVPEPAPAPESAPATASKFAAELARSNAEIELQGLRRECAQLRADLARLTEEVSRIKATGNMSPVYSEAMVLAQQGMPASEVAGHCGISIGEAELVAALARSPSDFERSKHDEEDEDRDEQHTDSGNRHRG